MAAPFIDPTFTADSLLEFLDDSSPSTGSSSWDSSAETITFQVPGDKLYEAQLTLLGYAWTAGISGSTTNASLILNRILPLSHPLKPNLFCTSISNWKGVGPRGKQTAFFHKKLTTAQLPQPSYGSLYDKVQLTANFTQSKYKLVADSNVRNANEFVRYTWTEQEPSGNMISLDKGTMGFVEGPSDVYSKPIQGPGYAQAENMIALTVKWTGVPISYVCDQNNIAIRLFNVMQCVNSQPFLGQPAGTLLLDPFHFEFNRMHLYDVNGESEFWCEITLPFRYFNPPYGTTGPFYDGTIPPTGLVRTRFGHQTAPRRPAEYYYFQNTLGQARYRTYDFNNIFLPLTTAERGGVFDETLGTT